MKNKKYKSDNAEYFHSATEVLGVDSADYITNDLIFIRIQAIPRKTAKIPTQLVEDIAKLVRKYNKKLDQTV